MIWLQRLAVIAGLLFCLLLIAGMAGCLYDIAQIPDMLKQIQAMKEKG